MKRRPSFCLLQFVFCSILSPDLQGAEGSCELANAHHVEVGLSYVLNTPDDQGAMLQQIGVTSIEELFARIPEAVRLRRPLEVPPALTEIELTNHVQQLAGRN